MKELKRQETVVVVVRRRRLSWSKKASGLGGILFLTRDYLVLEALGSFWLCKLFLYRIVA